MAAREGIYGHFNPSATNYVHGHYQNPSNYFQAPAIAPSLPDPMPPNPNASAGPSNHFQIRSSFCHECKNGFESLESLRKHIMAHGNLETTTYSCSCGLNFLAKDHVANHAKDLAKGCVWVEKPHDVQQAAGSVAGSPQPPGNRRRKSITCDACGIPYRSDKREKHLKSCAGSADGTGKPQAPCTCLICHQQFSRRYDFAQHRQTCKRPDVKIENDAEMPSRSSSSTSSSIGSVSHTGQNECPICFKSFLRKHHRDRHLLTHTKEKPFECPICYRKFSRREHRNRHINVHSNHKPYTCSICNISFTRNEHLQKHVTTHGVVPVKDKMTYTCNICFEMFTNKKKLALHHKTHR